MTKYGLDYGCQMWAGEAPRDSNSVEKVKLCGSNIY